MHNEIIRPCYIETPASVQKEEKENVIYLYQFELSILNCSQLSF